MSKPDITRLLIDSALQPELCRRLAEAPDGVFGEYELTAEERELLRRPDYRLLPLLGAALGTAQAQREPTESPAAPEIHTPNESRVIPDTQMALTVVPCLVAGQIAFAAWIAPMHEGADPSRIPAPAGAVLPGQPLTPLHAVIQLSSAASEDAAGTLQVSMWASFLKSTNAASPAPPEAAGNPASPPFGSPLDSPEVRDAAEAVHTAAPAERYEKLVTLTRALNGGDVR